MAYKFLDSTGLSHVFTKIKLLLDGKADNDHTHSYAGSSSVGGAANSAVKLANSRTINGVAFDGTKNISIDIGVSSVNGETGAVTVDDYVTGLSVSGKTVTYTKKDGTSGTITTQDTNTTYSPATSSAAGLMSAADKSKLDGISAGANEYILPTASASTLGGVKTTSEVTDISGYTATPIINGVPYYKDTNTTYAAATTSAAGLMSASDKSKLDGITANADSVSFSQSLTSGTKVGTITINGSATNLYCQTNTNTTYSNMTGATSSAAGKAGLVPAPAAGKQTSFLRGDGTWAEPGAGMPIVTASSSDGVTYTATANGITTLTTGMQITIIPNITSTSQNATLNLNSLGAKTIKQSTSYNTSTVVTPKIPGWMIANKPIVLMYDGTYWETVISRSNANDIYGTMPIANGGTGATTAEAALANLGGVPSTDVGNAANKIPKYNSDGHLVFPSGGQLWVD